MIMASLVVYIFLVFSVFLTPLINGDELTLAEETTVPWYESLPAVAMDYKVHIDPGKEDCYYQYVNPGATFYVSFQVSYRWSLQYFMISIYLTLFL